MKIDQRLLKLFVFNLVLYSLCVGIVVLYLRQPKRHVFESSPLFTELWTHSNIKLERLVSPYLSDWGLYMIVHDNSVVYFRRRPFRSRELQSLDLLTRDVNWQVKINHNAQAVVNNGHSIYVGFLDRPAEGYEFEKRGSVKFIAYDIESGHVSWSGIYQGIAGISSISATEQEVIFGGSFGHTGIPVQLTIDAHTGDLINYRETRRPRQLPDFPLPPDKKVVSNVAISDQVLFFLTEDALLWAVDEETGTILGTVQFAPNELSFNVLYDHHVTANSEFIIVYLGDSQQLFAFRFSP